MHLRKMFAAKTGGGTPPNYMYVPESITVGWSGTMRLKAMSKDIAVGFEPVTVIGY